MKDKYIELSSRDHKRVQSGLERFKEVMEEVHKQFPEYRSLAETVSSDIHTFTGHMCSVRDKAIIPNELNEFYNTISLDPLMQFVLQYGNFLYKDRKETSE